MLYFIIDVNLYYSFYERVYFKVKLEYVRVVGIILNVFCILYIKLFIVLMFLFLVIDIEFIGLNLNNEIKNRYL